MIKAGQKYLVTCDNWFVAPNGETYQSAWGTAKILTTEQCFNFKPARPSTNWFLRIGNDEKHIIIAGCQIHYVIKSKIKPKDIYKNKTYIDKDMGGLKKSASRIYFAE